MMINVGYAAIAESNYTKNKDSEQSERPSFLGGVAYFCSILMSPITFAVEMIKDLGSLFQSEPERPATLSKEISEAPVEAVKKPKTLYVAASLRNEVIGVARAAKDVKIKNLLGDQDFSRLFNELPNEVQSKLRECASIAGDGTVTPDVALFFFNPTSPDKQAIKNILNIMSNYTPEFIAMDPEVKKEIDENFEKLPEAVKNGIKKKEEDGLSMHECLKKLENVIFIQNDREIKQD